MDAQGIASFFMLPFWRSLPMLRRWLGTWTMKLWPNRGTQKHVRLVCTAGCPGCFGLALGGHPDVKGLVIVDVIDGGPAATWNANSSNGNNLEVGHLVVTVNGICDAQGMLEQFRNSSSVDMVISSKLSNQHRHVLRSSLGLQRRSKFVEILLETRNGECQPCTTCSICLEEIAADRSEAKLPCGHSFHKACVRRWLIAQHLRCPLCNSDFESLLHVVEQGDWALEQLWAQSDVRLPE